MRTVFFGLGVAAYSSSLARRRGLGRFSITVATMYLDRNFHRSKLEK
jgi:hypothetical protein